MIRGAPIELAAAIICSILPRGQTVTTRFIAEFCREIDPSVTVRHQDIYYLEQRALAKLRQAIQDREAGKVPRRNYGDLLEKKLKRAAYRRQHYAKRKAAAT